MCCVFVRSKTIKGKKYAYLVKNTWKKGKVKQQVKKYLGPIVLIKNKLVDFQSLDIDFSKKTKLVMRDIISNEFSSFGFKRKQARLIKDDLIINFSTNKIFKGDSSCVLLINDRFFYGGVLDSFQNFFAPESSEDRPGKKLAQLFSDSGIPIDQQDFVNLYKKIYFENKQK